MRRTKITFLMAFVFLLSLFSMETHAQDVDKLGGKLIRMYNSTNASSIRFNQWDEGAVYGSNSYEREDGSGSIIIDDMKYNYDFDNSRRTVDHLLVRGKGNKPEAFYVAFYLDYQGGTKVTQPGVIEKEFTCYDFIYNEETGDVLIPLGEEWIIPKSKTLWIQVQGLFGASGSWQWEKMNETATIDGLPHKKENYTAANPADDMPWLAVTNVNYSYSLRTSFTTDVALEMVSASVASDPVNSPIYYEREDFTDEVELGVRLYNMGKSAVSNVPVTYELNGETVTETYTGTIEPKSSVVYGFAQKMDFSAVGSYDVTTYVGLAGDEQLINDSAYATFNQYNVSYSLDADLNGTELSVCEGEFLDKGGRDGNSSTSNYAFTLKSATPGKMASLEFTYLDLKDLKYGAYVSSGTLNFYNGGDNTAPLLASIENVDINEGEEPFVVSAANADGEMYVEFVWSGNGPYSNWKANISCVDPMATDIAVLAVDGIDYADDFTATEDLTVSLYNAGSEDLVNIKINYSLNEGDTITETIASISSFTALDYTLANTFDLTTPGVYNWNVWIDLAGDANTDNNSGLFSIEAFAGEVYLIDTLVDDTLRVCEGLITDFGGIAGNTNNDVTNTRYDAHIFPPDADHRMKVTILEFDAGPDGGPWFRPYTNGMIMVSNDTTYNEDEATVFKYGDNPVGKSFMGFNETGSVVFSYTLPGDPGYAGFAAKIECVEILEKDLVVKDFTKPEVMMIEGTEYDLGATIINIGKETTGAVVAVHVNGEAVDTINIEDLAPLEQTTLNYKWVPVERGFINVEFEIVDDLGDEELNSASNDIEVFGIGKFVSSFEEGMPFGWYSTDDHFQVSFTSHGYHGTNPLKLGYLNTIYVDTLYTSMFKIEEEDQLMFYAETSTGMEQNLMVSWYDVRSNTTTLLKSIALTDAYTRYEIDLDDYIGGIGRFVFMTTETAKSCNIDYMAGPSYFATTRDIVLNSAYLPAFEVSGIASEASVNIINSGSELMEGDAVVNVINEADSSIIASFDVPAMLTGQIIDIDIPYLFDIEYNDFNGSIYLELVLEDDFDITNNESEAINVYVSPYGSVITETGNAQYSGDKPAYTNANYSVGQLIYTEEMIGNTGMLQGMVFQQADGDAQDSVFVKVWVGHTELETLSYWNADLGMSVDSLFIGDSLNLVYESYVNMQAGEVDWVIPFDTDFEYKGGKLAAIVYQMSESSVLRNFKSSQADSVYALVYQHADTIDVNCNDYTGVNIVGNQTKNSTDAKFIFTGSRSSFATKLTDATGTALENVSVSLGVDGSTLYSGVTATDGTMTIADMASANYQVRFELEGYEYIVMEEVNVTEGAFDLGTVVLAKMDAPVNVLTVVDNGAKTAVATWDAFAAKAFTYYNVYLDGELVADSVAETTYTFTDLADGEHIVGVQNVFDGGVSTITEATINVVYAPMNLNVRLFADNSALATWTFEGTSSDFDAYQVSLNGTVVDTVATMSADITGLVDGENTVSVVAMYTVGGLSASTEIAVTVVNAVTNLMATVDGTSASISWTGNAADAYNIYLNSDTIYATVADTVTSYAFTDLAAGTYVVGVAASYNGTGSAIEEVVFTIGDTKYAVVEDLAANVDEASHSATVIWTANNADSYNVYVNGADAVNVTEATYTIADLVTSYYLVKVTAVYGDVESDAVSTEFSVDYTSINSANAFELNIYPNPASNFVTIEGVANSTVQVFSLTGALVLSQDIVEATTKLNVSELNQGVYIVRVINEEGIAVKQLTIE